MIRYLLLCWLMAPQVLGNSKCDFQWFQCKDSNKPLNCDEDVNDGWIKYSKLCDGLNDCPDGSDEFLTLCKQHPKSPGMSDSYFYCASGGVISEDQVCDGNVDCSDQSDELPLNCNSTLSDNLFEAHRGSCSKNEFECRDRKCITQEKLCDGKFDCSNGQDESLEQCYHNCDNGEFQCGNGPCISNILVCNNDIDCLDGADELPTVCDGIEGYKPIEYRNCSEPTNVLSFHKETKYHESYNGGKYLLPNEPARFVCAHHWMQLNGAQWSVCQLNGTWHGDLPNCYNPRGLYNSIK